MGGREGEGGRGPQGSTRWGIGFTVPPPAPRSAAHARTQTRTHAWEPMRPYMHARMHAPQSEEFASAAALNGHLRRIHAVTPLQFVTKVGRQLAP